MSDRLREYFSGLGARLVDPTIVAEYERSMREKTIPPIDRAMKAQRRAAHFYLLGIPDPKRSA